MSDLENKYVTVVRLKNPFNVKNYDKDLAVWEPEKSVQEYLPVLETIETGDPEADITFVVSVNGKVIKEEEYSQTYLNAEDNIIICPVPGKGGGKSIFKLVAMIAVAIIAPQIGGMLAQSWTGAGMGLGMFESTFSLGQFIGTAISFVGKALVSAMFSDNSNSKANSSSSLDSSPSYGYDGAKNVSAEGVVVPIVYGQFRTGGNLINAYVENVNVDKVDTQFIYLQYCVSEGPISGVSDIKINDQDYVNFKDVTYETREGLSTQTMFGWFGDTLTPKSIGQKLNTSWMTFTTTNVVDKLRFDVVFPGGLFSVNTSSGNTESKSVEIQIQYRLQGTTTWNALGDNSVVDHYERRFKINGVVYSSLPTGYYDGKALNAANKTTNGWGMGSAINVGYGQTAYNDNTVYKQNPNYNAWYGSFGSLNANQYIVAGTSWDEPFYKSVVSITGATRNAVRKSYTTPVLTQGIYETRYMRSAAESTANNVSDAAYMNEINQIVVDDVQYNNTAMLAVRVKLSDQLSGMPKVTFLVNGVKIRTWDDLNKTWATETSNNPAWIVFDMLTNTRYGANVVDSRIDIDMFKDWAKHCSLYNLTFDGVFDTSLNLWSAMQYVLRAGHAQIVIIGTKITVAIDRVSSPVMMFSVANIVEGSFQINWLPMSDRANEIEVNYFDKVDDFKQRAIKLYDSAAIDAGIPLKSTSVTLYGVTDAQRASSEALLMLNMNKYITQTVQFDAPIEAIGCTIGDLIYVQHDMPQWGYAGRLEYGSTSSIINLDRPMTMEAGKIYRLLVLFDYLDRFSGVISAVTGNSITLTGFNGSSNVKRLRIYSGSTVLYDREVSSVFSGTGVYGVILNDATGITVGLTYKLVDTDVLEERDIVNPGAGTYSVVTLQSALSSVPAQFVQFMFGENTKMKKPFRVRSISGTGDYIRTILAVEYNESIFDYDDTTNYPTPNYSALDTQIKHVTINSVTEALYRLGSSFGVHATVNYSSSQDSYKTSRVLISRNGGAFLEAGTGAESVTVSASDGEVLKFKVVAVDALGLQAPLSSAPTITHTVIGKLAPPADVQGFSYLIRTEDIQLSWIQNQDIDIAGYEVRRGSSWDSGIVVFSGLALMALDKIDAAGTVYYHIRAYDTSGVYSSNVVSQAITLVAPNTVSNFITVQSGTRVDMRWDANPEKNITYYEIREGATWLSSALIGTTKSTTYSVPAGGGSRIFWIKAVVSPGIYSASAVLSNTAVATSDNRNIILTYNNTSSGFTGAKNNVIPFGYGVQFNGGQIAEYSFTVNLGATYHAANTLYTAFSAVQQSVITWASSTWTWASADAQNPWLIAADLNAVEINFQIATNVSLGATDVDGWRLDNALTSVNNIIAAQSLGVTYPANGRYSSGAYVSQLTTVSWNITLPSLFKYVFWVRPTTLNAGRFVTLSNTNEELAIGFDGTNFYVKDNKPQTVSVPYTFSVNQILCIGVVQTATSRKLFVGDSSGTTIASAEQPYIPSTSQYTKLRLY